MTDSINNGGPAFPILKPQNPNFEYCDPGMTLRDWFAGQALANPVICNGEAKEWQLNEWFGRRSDITRAEVVAKQAHEYAVAMLEARK